MRHSVLTFETALYLALAGLALTVRLYALGLQPLDDAEARDALLTYRFVQGGAGLESAKAEPLPTPSSPLLFSLTSLSFLLFGASDTSARLMPALAGGLLALTPAYFRRQLGPLASLVMAALIALSPTLLAASRLADVVMPLALALAVLAGSLVAHSHTGQRVHLYVAAAAAGAALAAGPRLITVLLILVIGTALWRLLDGAGLRHAVSNLRSAVSSGSGLVRPAVLAGIVLLACASAFLLYRPGVAAVAQALPAWIAGWAPATSGASWLHLPSLLLVYEPFTLFLGLMGLGRLATRWNTRDGIGWTLAALALAAFAVGLLYPGRTSADVTWIILPLAGLGSLFIVELFAGDWNEIDAAAVVIQAALVIVLVSYAALNLAAFSQAERSFSGTAAANLGLAGVSLALVGLISLLFGVGWSLAGAVRGLVFGLSVALLLAGLSSAVRLVHWGEDPEMAGELWHAGQSTPLSGMHLLKSTLEDVSGRAVGSPHEVDVVVSGSPGGALDWALREFPVAYIGDLAAGVTSSTVIASAELVTPELGSAYVGQSFAVRGRLDTASRAPLDWLSWLAFHRQPTQTESVVLWVRSDVQFQSSDGLAQ